MHDVSTFDTQFRPLLGATVASGLCALGILQFAGSGWNSFGDDGRALIAIAARTAFLSFVLNAVSLLIAYLFANTLGPLLTFLVNLYGVGVFMAGTFLTGGLLSGALDLASPKAADPPENIQAFLGLVGVGGLALMFLIGLSALIAVLRRSFKRPSPNALSSQDEPDANA